MGRRLKDTVMTDDVLRAQVRALCNEDRKIEAIKLYRQVTGAGLAEAKRAVEAIAAGEPLASFEPADAAPREFDATDEVVELLRQGRAIEAIKLYRARTGVGLKDAKDAVDAIAQRHGVPRPRGCGCLPMLLVAMACTATLLAAKAAQQPATGAKGTPPTVAIADAPRGPSGEQVLRVQSPYQAGTTEIRVLGPDRVEPGRRYPVVYVLPVEPRGQSRYGDGLREVKLHNLANKHEAFFVAPTFTQMPWYADHPRDPRIRQETHFVSAVVPAVDDRYPVQRGASGRLLLGFSKSGYGAVSLLVRHPDVFGKAAAFDAPLMQQKPDRYEMGVVFADDAGFAPYRLADLSAKQVDPLRQGDRIALWGYANFRAHHRRFHDRLTQLGVSHIDRDGPGRAHDWHSGWVAEAVGVLLRPQPAQTPAGSARP